MDDKDKPKLTLVSDQSEPKKKKRRPLTVKQEAFFKALTKGGPDGKGMTQADAYKSAYDCEKMSDNAIYTEAWKLVSQHPELTRRILSHKAGIEKAALTSALTRRHWIVKRLEHEATSAESDAARVRALELLGKDSQVKLWSDVVETIESEETPDEVRAQLEARLTALLGQD